MDGVFAARRFPRPPQYTYTTPPMSPAVLSRRGTPRRYVLREPELPDLNHFTRRKGKAPITNKGWNPYRPFATVPLLEYGGLKPILPFLEGRSDAARRVVIRLHAVSVDVRMGIVGAGGVCSDAACHVVIRLRNSRRCLRGVNDGRYGNPPNDLLAVPTVGAGSSQREDSPAHRNIRIPCHPWSPVFYNNTTRGGRTLRIG